MPHLRLREDNMTIELSFHGAAGTVTGSCYRLRTSRASVIVDCGMFQGSKTLKQLNYDPFPFDVRTLDAVLVTHAHIDHSGLLPKLMIAGYKGRMHCTTATAGLLGCMLPDSGHIQESEVEQLNRRKRHRGHDPVTPIYTAEDAVRCLDQLETVDYDAWTTVADGIRARWWNAGHLLGSASIEIEADDGDGKPLRLLFSGDIGPDHKLLQAPAEGPSGLDVVVVESTYGGTDRNELSNDGKRTLLMQEVREAAKAGGALLIPSFAVERTQEIVTDLIALMDAGRIPQTPVFVDSPLAGKATEVFKRFADELGDGAALRKAFASPHLHMTESVEQSKALARFDGFHIIVAASGMCEAGRIRHHLRHWLARRQTTVLIVGYQAVGTLGRILQEGAKAVRIQGDEVLVRARIRTLDCYSGHADGPELIDWLRKRGRIGAGLFLVHGEDEAVAGLKQRVISAGLMPESRIIAPAIDDVFELGPAGVRLLSRQPDKRIDPKAVSRLDWHNDLSKLLIDIDEAVGKVADEKGRQRVIRQLRRALDASEDDQRAGA
jgi:metallo-beta-lactamase family protein